MIRFPIDCPPDCPHLRWWDMSIDDLTYITNCGCVEQERRWKVMDASTILEVTRTLIGATEPYGDSGIDRERTENLDKLLYVVDELLYDVEKAAVCKTRYEGSMRMMGKKAHKALSNWWLWIEDYLKENGEWKKVESDDCI